MKVSFEGTSVSHGQWSVSAQGTFNPGIHLVSGDVGSGKTTLALLLAGLLAPETGAVAPEQVSSRMCSFQFPEYQVTGLTVRDECASWGLDPGGILASVNLSGTEEYSPLALSRGELKRLHLACIMAKDYDLLVLDEPFSSLDCPEKERVCEELSRKAGGITVIFTHEQAIFPRVDTLWEISGGALQCRGGLPAALPAWEHAPRLVKELVRRGTIPENITPDALREAACRT
jgi:energy-coupling factor transport system ATP-binding protein